MKFLFIYLARCLVIVKYGNSFKLSKNFCQLKSILKVHSADTVGLLMAHCRKLVRANRQNGQIFVRDITLCAQHKLIVVYDCQLICSLELIAAQTIPQHVSANQCSAKFRLNYRNCKL
jgi:hypothetical protein